MYVCMCIYIYMICKSSKPQGLEENLRHEFLKTDRISKSRKNRFVICRGQTSWLFGLRNNYIVVTISGFGIVHNEYMALAKQTSVLREAMLSLFEPAWSAVNKHKSMPRRVCRHMLKPCWTNITNMIRNDCLFITQDNDYHSKRLSIDYSQQK